MAVAEWSFCILTKMVVERVTLITGFAFAHVATRKGESDKDLLEMELWKLIFG